MSLIKEVYINYKGGAVWIIGKNMKNGKS
jgi:hypothetical protein